MLTIKMARKFLQFLLKLLNFFLALVGLAMVVYGFFRLSKWNEHHSEAPSPSNNVKSVGDRRLLVAVHLAIKLPSPWFIYSFMVVGILVFIISCFGCVGSAARNPCCTSLYSALITMLILIEVGVGAFIFFDHNWKKVIPTDKTGNLESIYTLFHSNWKIMQWVVVAVFTLQIVVLLTALCLQAAMRVSYESSNEERVYCRSRNRNNVVPVIRTPPIRTPPMTENRQVENRERTRSSL